MHSPANIVTIRRNRVALKGVLKMYKRITKLVDDPSQEHPTSSCETLIKPVSVRPSQEDMVDPRKEQRAGIGSGSILAEEPQMVTTIKALKARSEERITVVLSQLEGLVHPAISVSQIRSLRAAEVNA